MSGITASTSNSETGRSAHLGAIQLVFYHRGATWRDLAQFFDGYVQANAATLACRHEPGKPLIEALKQTYPEGVLEDSWRWHRPCQSMGAWEKNKNAGIVVSDFVRRAVAYLLTRGIGDLREESGRDFTYESGDDPSSDLPSVSAGPESDDKPPSSGRADLHMSDIVSESRRPVLAIEWPEDDLEALALYEELEAVSVGSDNMGVSDPTGPGLSETDSIGQDLGRSSSTKMRVQVIGYLASFADDAYAFREKFLELRGSTAALLHLCGCGMCRLGPSGERGGGCCEGSHLRLGEQSENLHHSHVHFGLEGVEKVDDYLSLVRIFHDTSNFPDCSGVF